MNLEKRLSARSRPTAQPVGALGNVLLILLAAFLTADFPRATWAQPAFPDASFEILGEIAHPETHYSFTLPEDPVDGAVYLFGGLDDTAVGTRYVRVFDLATETWLVLPNALPYPWHNNERHSSALASNGKVYIGPGNGWAGWGQNDRIIEFDPALGVGLERAALIAPGVHIWGVALAPAPPWRGGVYLIGGWTGGGQTAVRHYDPDTDQMTIIGYLSAPRTVGARVTHPNGRIYAFGGNTQGTLAAVDVLDTATESVRAVPNPLGFRFVHGTQAWVGDDDMIYLWNPRGSFMGASSDRIVRFDPVTEAFEIAGETPLPTGLPLSAFADPVHGRVLFFVLLEPGYVWGSFGVAAPQVWALTTNQSPVALAGDDQILDADETCTALVELDGIGSYDDDGDPLTFRWLTPAGTFEESAVSLELAPGTYDAVLEVDDGRGGTGQDSLVIQIRDASPPWVSLVGPDAIRVECGQPWLDPGATAGDACDPAPVQTSTGEVEDSIPGTYTLNYGARDAAGNLSQPVLRTVVVADSTAPTVPAVVASPSRLWPPNHSLQRVDILGATAVDSCSATTVCRVTAVASNETGDATGDGHTQPDWQIVGPTQVLLRAERSGRGSGRVYSIEVTCWDEAGNASVGHASVRVPKNPS